MSLAAARVGVRPLRLASVSHISRRTASNIPPVGSGQPDPQTTTTSGRPGPATTDRRQASGTSLPYILGFLVLAGGAYVYLQEDPQAKAKVKAEAQSAENKAKELYEKSKSEAKSVFGQTENKAKSASRDVEGRGEDLLESARAKAKDVQKDAQDGWFKLKGKAEDATADARDALSKAGDRARSEYEKTANSLNSKTQQLLGQAEDESRAWYHFGQLKRKEGEAEASRQLDSVEKTASSWWSSAKKEARDAKETAKSKL